RGATATSTSTLGISRSSHKPHRLPVTVGMRTRRSFLVDDEATAFEALRRHGFATLISVGDDGRLYASRLATILRRDRARRTRFRTTGCRSTSSTATRSPTTTHG